MNFQQLRIIRETVRQNFNLTEASNALYTSQSGVSKHIKDLEDELGVQLFVRKGKRLLGLTDAGQAVLQIVERMLIDADNIKYLAQDFHAIHEGTLTIATTHTQARYVLPQIVSQFKQRFPKVHLILQQASPVEIREMLLHGDADIGIATESLTTEENLASVPYYHWYHSVVVPLEHELAQIDQVTLQDLAKYPLVTYHGGFTGRSKIDQCFKDAGLNVDVVMSALDADVIKTYVELGLGIGIISDMSYHPQRDNHLKQIHTDIFGKNTTWIAVRKGHLLRGFGYDFIQLCSEDIDIQTLKNAAFPDES
ncbi:MULTISPECIES: CysB family HTH-type transcriptional regulator [unclassified Acinetobacter]|uniref:CysB family HTH-type transcriptional regulator n=1 Tax=unclassified Acinetobacter TaxID=196816 RepID=UPI0035BB5AAA